MSFYTDLHNLYHGDTVPVVGPVEDEIEEESEEVVAQIQAPNQSVTQAMEKTAKEQEYLKQLQANHREQQLATVVNTAVYGAGIYWFWDLITKERD